jgi:hypothetical protein
MEKNSHHNKLIKVRGRKCITLQFAPTTGKAEKGMLNQLDI